MEEQRDDGDNDDDDDGQEVTHSKQEVTHGSDPRWVTSAANNRKSRAALAQFIIIFLLALLFIRHIPIDTISPLQSTQPS